MMKSNAEEVKIPGLYDWKQKMGLFVQFVSGVVLIVLLILDFIKGGFTRWIFLTLFVTLGSMAYNNYATFERKHFTILYLIGAIFSLCVFGSTFLG